MSLHLVKRDSLPHSLRTGAIFQPAMAALLLVSLTLPAPVQAECYRETSPVLAQQTRYLIAAAAHSMDDPAIQIELLRLRSSVRCGDANAIATVQSFLNQPDTELLATIILIDADQRGALEFLDALERAPYSLEDKAWMLEIAAEWMQLRGSAATEGNIVQHTEWAAASGNHRLARLADELRALYGDDISLARRTNRLMACAESAASDPSTRCLGIHEMKTAPFTVIRANWDLASSPQRVWLARWAQPSRDNQAFFLSRLPGEDSSVQYQILTESMEGGETREYAIKAAVALIWQAATDATRHPRSVPIDFSTDYWEGMFGATAYESGRDYPLALFAAFEELATYPYEDVGEAMQQSAMQDHPWLATQAGMWLVRHGQTSHPTRVLRYTLEDDGLPPPSVLQQIHPLSDTRHIPQGTRDLFLSAIETGSLGKWRAFTGTPFESMLEEQAVIDAILVRIARLPPQLAAQGIDPPMDNTLEAYVDERPNFRHELVALEWAIETGSKHPDVISRYIQALEANHMPMWQALALMVATEFDHTEAAQRIASGLVDLPHLPLRTSARTILGLDD